MSRATAFIERMGETAIHFNRTWGVRDVGFTEWPLEVWGAGHEIKIFVDEILTREDDSMRGGRITLKRMKAFTKRADGVTYRDRIIYPWIPPAIPGDVFYVESVTTVEYLYGMAQFDRVILVQDTG